MLGLYTVKFCVITLYCFCLYTLQLYVCTLYRSVSVHCTVLCIYTIQFSAWPLYSSVSVECNRITVQWCKCGEYGVVAQLARTAPLTSFCSTVTCNLQTYLLPGNSSEVFISTQQLSRRHRPLVRDPPLISICIIYSPLLCKGYPRPIPLFIPRPRRR